MKPISIDLNTSEGQAAFKRASGGMVLPAGEAKRQGDAGTVELWLGPLNKVTHPNGRTRNYHWKAKVIKQQKEAAWLEAKRAMGLASGFPWSSATVHVTYYTAGHRPVDHDNTISHLKPSLDALAPAGLIVDDSGLKFGGVEIVKVKPSDERKAKFKIVLAKGSDQ